MGLSFVCFGFIESMDKQLYILSLGFTLRFIQGCSSAFVQTTCYSIATNDFPEQKEMIVGWVEAMTGLGLIIGPIVGSALYAFFGYSSTFYIYGFFLVFLAGIIKINFPEKDTINEERLSEIRTLLLEGYSNQDDHSRHVIFQNSVAVEINSAKEEDE